MVASTGDPRARDDWQLVISAAAGVVRRHIQPGAEIVIGRGDHVDVDVHDESVSRRHARLRVGDPLRIEDLGSRNGTFVAGRRLAAGEAVTVPLGAVVELGSTFLVVHRGSLVNGLAANPPSAEMLVVGETMQRLYGLLDTIAPSTLRVLILGETGTGKEVYARAVHARSDRAARPFIALNCASLVESLLESELFGHEKGAFTGATEAKPGLLEQADGGTVFLDEIGELPLGVQAKLLRVLETLRVTRLGAVRDRSIDVRIVAATNRDLALEVAAGQF
ncbi:MAG TPA: sigma-54-dependent Fis family transcriptional regulator, partial [Kofleriaceae bacterium]|nr:sigma-54-dependent Fis family transcriptional regulator [Kofleriaceae bacterium]